MAKRKYTRRIPPERDQRRRERNTERNKAIYARRQEGVFLERIGDEFGLSGEMIRQIVMQEERKRAKRSPR
jgi:hypothetical protein